METEAVEEILKYGCGEEAKARMLCLEEESGTKGNDC
jgi:hypothetical protein